jgi:hypothetical protein
LKQNTKAQSEERKTTRSRNQTLQTRCFNFQSQAQANGQEWAQIAKREQQLSLTSFVTTTANKKGN